MKKINLRDPKYIFPLIIAAPLIFLAYIIAGFFPDSDNTQVASEGLNLEVPDANTDDILSKYDAMSQRFARDDDAYTAMGEIGMDIEGKESLEDAYSDAEKERIDRENAERAAQEEALRQMQESFARSRERVRTAGTVNAAQAQEDDYAESYRQMQQLAEQRQRLMQSFINGGSAAEEKKPEPVVVTPPEPPKLVLKSSAANADKFHTISDTDITGDDALIKAMIDKTTKAHEGTRLRFKLLDDVTIEDVELKKGTYLYGTVVGFGQQRVMAEVSSILVGNKFLKVSLAVFDNDGMEGFYVPESAFRDFMKNAGASAVSNNINFTSGNYGSEISGENIALQALQNVYSAGTNAISANMRKNRAKIKYNTIVYLINSKEAI